MRERWVPVGDDAIIAMKAYDVFTSNSPRLGMPSTVVAGTNGVAHLGPLLFWLLAVPLRLTHGSPAAIVFVVGLLNVSAIVCTAWLVRRQAGPVAAVVSMAFVLVVEIAIGRDLLGSVLNMFVVLLPTGAFLAAAWAAACGDAVGLLPLAGFGSLAALSHLIYLPLVGVVAVLAVAGYVHTRRRARTSATNRRVLEVAAVTVAAICWSTVVYDTLVHWPGNLWRAVRTVGAQNAALSSARAGETGPVGVIAAIRGAVRVVAQVPLWLAARNEHHASLFAPLQWWELLLGVAFASVVAVAAVRSRDRRLRVATVGAAVALAVTTWSLSRIPASDIALSGLHMQFAYVVGGFVGGVVVFAAASLLRGRIALQPRSLRSAIALAAMMTALALLTLPATTRRSPEDVTERQLTDPSISSATRNLASGRAHLVRGRVYALRSLGGFFPSPLEYGIIWELYRHGINVRVSHFDPYLGATHALAPHAHVPSLYVADAGAGHAGSRLIASSAPPVSDVRWLIAGLRRAMVDMPVPPGMLTDRASDWFAANSGAALRQQIVEGKATALDIVQSGRLAQLLQAGVFNTNFTAYRYLAFYRVIAAPHTPAPLALYLDPANR